MVPPPQAKNIKFKQESGKKAMKNYFLYHANLIISYDTQLNPRRFGLDSAKMKDCSIGSTGPSKQPIIVRGYKSRSSRADRKTYACD